jgi:hypothetical protein
MKPATPLQSIVDPFVRGIGGELVSDLQELVGNNEPPPNADYLFRRHNVIAELKTLQANSFGDPFCKKFGDRLGVWHKSGRLIVYGTTRVDTDKLSPDCQREILDLMAAPLERQVFSDANKQIRSTKKFLNLPEAKGLLWVASDGNEDLQPNVVWYLLTRIIQKKKQNGEPLYSNIDGLAYFAPRMLVKMPNSDKPAQIWLSGTRQPGDQTLNACLNELSKAWPRYVSRAQGSVVEEIDGNTSAPPPQGINFLGVTPRMPRVEVNYSGQPARGK